MGDLGVTLPVRRAVVGGLLVGAVVVAVPVLTMALRALTSSDQRLGYGLGAVVVGLVGVVLPLLMARAVNRSRVRVLPDAVERVAGERVLTRLALADVEEIRVTAQVSPGVLGRRPIVALLGPGSNGARGVVANGLLIADLEPLLDRVAAEVQRRPDMLTSDRGLYDQLMAARPYS